MACFEGILEEFYQEVEPMESFLCVTLSPISCVFPALHPNVQDPFGTLDFFPVPAFFPWKMNRFVWNSYIIPWGSLFLRFSYSCVSRRILHSNEALNQFPVVYNKPKVSHVSITNIFRSTLPLQNQGENTNIVIYTKNTDYRILSMLDPCRNVFLNYICIF